MEGGEQDTDGPHLRLLATWQGSPERCEWWHKLTRKVESKTGITILVIGDTVDELLICFRMKGEVHEAKRFRILSNTSFPGIGVTCGGRSKPGPKVAVYFYPVSVCNGPFAQGAVSGLTAFEKLWRPPRIRGNKT